MKADDMSTLFASLPPMSDRAGRVLGHLIASGRGHTTRIGIPNLQRRLGNPRTGRPASRSSIQKALRELEYGDPDRGYPGGVISCNSAKGRQGINTYRIHVPEPEMASTECREDGQTRPALRTDPPGKTGPINKSIKKSITAEPAGVPTGRPHSAEESKPWPRHVLAEMKRRIRGAA